MREKIESMLNSISFLQEYKKNKKKDVVGIAEKLGYEIIYFAPNTIKELNTNGILDRNEQKIYINNIDIEKQQRFTLAHEIGHIFLHEDEKLMLEYRNKESDVKETEANLFAAELLMPEDETRDLFDTLSKNNIPNKEGFIIDKLANTFMVSRPDMEIRLLRLKLLPINSIQ